MKSQKLAERHREEIIDRLLKHRFEEPREELNQRIYAFGIKVYNDIFPADMREKMEALPNGWLPEDDDLSVQFGGGDRYQRLRLGTQKRFPNDKARGCLKVYEHDHPFTLQWNELDAESRKMSELERELIAKARSVLNSVTTSNRLLQVWPEIEPFLEGIFEVRLATLPAPLINELVLGFNMGDREAA